VQISDSNHARVHVVVRTDPDDRRKVDLAGIEKRIAQAATTWTDRLRAALVKEHDEAAVLALAHRYRHAFPLAYEEEVAPRTRSRICRTWKRCAPSRNPRASTCIARRARFPSACI